jgi:hypothetical protein
MRPKPTVRSIGRAAWSLSTGIVLLARVQGGSTNHGGHVRWSITLADRDVTIGVTREQAKVLLEGLEAS